MAHIEDAQAARERDRSLRALTAAALVCGVVVAVAFLPGVTVEADRPLIRQPVSHLLHDRGCRRFRSMTSTSIW
jgi:hypothetical protein